MSLISEIQHIENKSSRLEEINNLKLGGLTDSEIQDLICYFSDPYWPVREAAAKKLASLGTRASKYLVSAIASPNEDTKFWASQVLSIVADDEAIKLLIDSFAFYEENEINMYSAKALIKMGGQTIDHLDRALSSDNDLIRLYSVYCLGELKPEKSARKIENLLLFDSNFAVRKNAAVALGKIFDPDSLDPLINAISDKSWYVRVAATEALGKYKNFIERKNGEGPVPGEPQIATRQMQSKITNSILSSLSDTEARVREIGARVLSSSGGVSAEEPLLQLLASSVSDGEKLVAVKSLGNISARSAVPALEKLYVQSPSNELKKEILTALGKIASDSSLGVLLGATGDENVEVAISAVNALLDFRKETALSELPGILEDKREEVRAAAVTALGKTDSFDVRRYLYPALEDSSYIVRRQALLSLFCLLGDEIISEAIDLISDPEELVASEAIAIVSKIKSSDAIPALSKAIERGNKKLSYMAFLAFASIGSESEYAVLQYLRSADRDVCYQAINAIEKIGSAACVEPLIDLIKRFGAEDEIVSRALTVLAQFEFKIDVKFFVDILKSLATSHYKVIEILGKSETPAVAAEITPFLSSQDRETRFHAAAALGRLKNDSEAVISALVNSLKDKHWPVRKAAAEALATLGDRAIKRLVSELEKTNVNADILYWALRSLSEAGVAEALPIFNRYLGSGNADLKKVIIKGLGRIPGAGPVGPLVDLLGDGDREIRFHAVKALKNVKDARVLPHLIKLMGDEYENVRSFSAIALGNFKTEESIAALKSALNDKSHWVAKYSRESLSKLLK